MQHLSSKFSQLQCPSSSGRCRNYVNVTTVHDAYHNMNMNAAACDQCNQTLASNDIVLHCKPNKTHQYGFDLCVNCGEKVLIEQQKVILQKLKREV